MPSYTITYKVRDGLISKKNYEFSEIIEAENPRQAFDKAKQLCKDSSGYISPRWEIKGIKAKGGNGK